MKYLAEIVEITDLEQGSITQIEITSDSVDEANAAIQPYLSSYSGKTYKKYIHICGNIGGPNNNIKCVRTEI